MLVHFEAEATAGVQLVLPLDFIAAYGALGWRAALLERSTLYSTLTCRFEKKASPETTSATTPKMAYPVFELVPRSVVAFELPLWLGAQRQVLHGRGYLSKTTTTTITLKCKLYRNKKTAFKWEAKLFYSYRMLVCCCRNCGRRVTLLFFFWPTCRISNNKKEDKQY